jgi:hypothetical protein
LQFVLLPSSLIPRIDSTEDEADAATLMDEAEQFLREQGDGK